MFKISNKLCYEISALSNALSVFYGEVKNI